MTYREAHAALMAKFPKATPYGEVRAEAIRLAGGYVQGLKLLHELAGMGAYRMGTKDHAILFVPV